MLLQPKIKITWNLSTTTSELGNLDMGMCPANLESDKIDNGESCAVTSAKTLLTSKGISYNETRLNKCICKDKDCNANIATINKCLEESGLKTYTYKTNQTMLKTGDIIHLEINRIGHYIIYEENKTDLTNFTGYTITTKELTEQKTIPLAIQKKYTDKCIRWNANIGIDGSMNMFLQGAMKLNGFIRGRPFYGGVYIGNNESLFTNGNGLITRTGVVNKVR